MGCFCMEAVQSLQDDEEPAEPEKEQPPPEDETVAAVGNWLAARWLPALEWTPDPEWLEAKVPDPPMPPEALGVLIGLVQACQAGQMMQLDLTEPEQAPKLARIVGTLNRRMQDVAWVEQDTRPWDKVAALNDQADSVRAAVVQGVFPEQPEAEPEPPIAPWRPLIVKVKALTPLLAVGQMLGLDLADVEAPEQLAKLVRNLRRVRLPPLENPVLVLRVIARLNAIARIKASFGADPRRVPFERVVSALERKMEAVRQMLPEQVQLEDGQLVGMPPKQPNPSQLINADILEAAQKIKPRTLEQLDWRPPPSDQLDLLTTGAPVMTLARLMATLGTPPVRTGPCGRQCDAAAVARAGAHAAS